MVRSNTGGLLVLALWLFAGIGCSTPQRTEPPPATQEALHVAEFFDRLKSDVDGQWLDQSGGEWLASLPAASRVRIAERALQEADPEVRLVAPLQFYALGMDARGDAAVAELALAGVDVSGLTWAWLHSADRTLLERRISAIRRLMLSRYNELTPGQRARAEKMLCPKEQACDLAREAADLQP